MIKSCIKVLYTSIIALLLFSSFSLNAEEMKELIWSADAESGAPYVYTDSEVSDELIGFEVEVLNAICRIIGRKPVHYQNQWDGLIPGLMSRDDYQVVINGIEITPERMKEVAFSVPYFATYEVLVVKKGVKNITNLSDLYGKKAGTLGASYAEKLLRTAGGIDVYVYESEVNSFKELKFGRLDAVLIDFPVALYYAIEDPELELVGPPIGQITYGVTLRQDDVELKKEIDRAIYEISKTGELECILRKWKLWDEFMEVFSLPESLVKELRIDTAKFVEFQCGPKPGPGDGPGPIKLNPRSIERYLKFMPVLGKGALVTIGLSVASMILAIVLGLLMALMRVYGPRPISILATLYIEIIRGTPLLVQLLIIYYALPELTGITLNNVTAAIIGLGMNYSAYEAENYRAGLMSVPKGQMEAALSLGMTRRQSLKHVIIPQAIRLVLPPLTNDFISLLKDSSLVAFIAVVELTKTYSIIAAETLDHLGFGLIVAAMYLIIGLPFVKLSKMAEAKFHSVKQK